MTEQEFETGTIRHIKPGHPYGKIAMDDAEIGADAELPDGLIFFHFEGRHLPVLQDGSLTLVWASRALDDRASRVPQEGDRVCFRRSRGNNGRIKAAPWVYEDELRLSPADDELPFYSVIALVWLRGDDTWVQRGEPHVVWEGTDLEELARLHPQLNGMSDGSVRVTYRFEVWLIADDGEDGRWMECSDPRPQRPQALRPVATDE